MNEASNDLQQARSRICDMMFVASAVLAIPTASASLYRSLAIGWIWTMGVHLTAAALILIFFIFRKSIPYTLRAGTIIFIFLFIGMASFWQFGMVAGANPMLLVAPIFATILFGKRLGIWFAIAVFSMMVLTAYSFIYGGRTFQIEFDMYGTFLPSWITYLLTTVLAVATSIAAISISNRHLESSLALSRQSQNELANLNRDLEKLIFQRTLELDTAKQKAERQARTDVLTGLNNRRAFFENAEMIDAQSRRYKHVYVVAMIDIDHFKLVNDTWGHEAGDIALQTVGRVISGMLRESDVIGRIGGEEFAVILPETTAGEGAALAERLRVAIEETMFPTSHSEIKITISVGIASLDDQSYSLEKVVANSDAAMYLAKKSGRNRIETHQGQFGKTSET